MDIIDDFARKTLSRRGFLATAGTAAAAVAVGCNDATAPATAPPALPGAGTPPAFSDTDILNFALNLEYLEAEFYLRAATGAGIPAADAGTGAGTVVGGAKVTGATNGTTLVPLTAAQQEFINIIAQDEYNHVKFLRAALGSLAIPRPNIDLLNSFNALATAATVGLASPLTPLTSFNPFANFQSFLVGGFVFEDVGVTAYHGGAGLLTPKSPYLTPAAQILAVEAYHAAALRTLLVGTRVQAGSLAATGAGTNVLGPVPSSNSGAPLSTYGTANATLPTYGQFASTSTGNTFYLQLAQAIATFRAAVSGGTSVAAGAEVRPVSGETFVAGSAAGVTPVVAPSFTVTSSTIVPADANSIAFARTFDQVLHIVYGTQNGPTGLPYGVTSGGFFPNGVNGLIKQTYS